MPTNDRKPTGTQGQDSRKHIDTKDQSTDRKQTAGSDDRTAKSGMSGNANPQKSGGKGDHNDHH